MMKKLWLVIIVFLFFVVGCSETSTEVTSTPPVLMVQTLTDEVTPTAVEVTAALTNTPTPGSSEEPTPSATPKPTEASPTSVPLDVPSAVATWLEMNAIALDTEQPGSGCFDLQPLLTMIGNARIVALGEATHGTSEFFSLKHRIVECLVEEKGFDLLLIEDNWSGASQVNHYLQSGETSASQVIRELSYWAWHTEEVLQLVRWMRRHNETSDKPTPISFHGIDVTQVHNALKKLLDYIEEVDVESFSYVETELNCFRQNYIGSRPLQLTEAQYQRCREGVQNVYSFIMAQQETYETVPSSLDYDDAVYITRLLVKNEQLRSNPENRADLRSSFMAANVSWFMEQGGPEAKAIIWAHNGHVQGWPVPIQYYTEAGPTEIFGTYTSMGSHLREHYGSEMIVIGFTFEHGEFNAQSINSATGYIGQPRRQTVMPPLPGSIEPYLAIPGLSRYLLDLRPAMTDENVADWFSEERWFRAIGWGYDSNNVAATTQPIVLPKAFDIIIYIENSSPTKLLP